MKVDKLTLLRVFDQTERLEAPLFQRPYVWKKDQNWEPLWESIQSMAEKRLTGLTTRPHFLGTIVLDQLSTGKGRIHARQIIDGQQRLTTLQLALAAARDLCRLLKQPKYASAFKKLTENDMPLSEDADDIFKVWPTNADRQDFREVMKATSADAVGKLPHANPHDDCLIPDAYLYFAKEFAEWLGPEGNSALSDKLDAVYKAITEDLHLVVIDLDRDDDAQEIFETLNYLGTPLQAADLVKNFLFHLADFQKEDTLKLYHRYWESFDTGKAYWREEIRQGRLKRSRVDLFLYHYLTLKTGEEITASQLFSSFRDFVKKTNGESASKHMDLFRSYSDVYKTFEEFPEGSRGRLFFYRLEQLDTATVYPLLLEVVKRYNTPEGLPELVQILVDLESFLVRRAVCELTAKNYNKLFLELVKKLGAADDFSAASIRKFLLAQTAEVSRWPGEEEFQNSWLTVSFYKRVKRSTTRMVLEALDVALHDPKSEKMPADRELTIEHLLPQEWEKNWPLAEKAVPAEAMEKATKFRNEMLHKIGNLTLLTKKLNPSVSNGPWTDKRKEILKHSALNLNRPLPETWNEVLIFTRSGELCKHAMRIWPRP